MSWTHPNLSRAVSAYLLLPGIRGLWSMSVYDSNGDAQNLAMPTHEMGYNGDPAYGYENYAPYIALDGTGDWLNLGDHADFDIIGNEGYIENPGLTLGAWVYIDDVTGAGYQDVIVKYDAGGGEAYGLTHSNGNGMESYVYSGAAQTTSGDLAVTSDAWHFVAGLFVPSTEVSVFADGVWLENESSIPATIDNTAADLTIGGNTAGSSLLTGKESLVWICAGAVPKNMIYEVYKETMSLFV